MNSELRYRNFAIWGVLLFALGLGLLHQGYLTRAHPDAVYMDTLRLIHQLDAWQQGSFPLYDLWNQSAHRGLIFQTVLAANIQFLSLDVLVANRLTGLVILGVAWLIVLDFWRATASVPGLKGLSVETAAACLMAALCFGWAGFEVLTLDLGLPLWLKNFAFVWFFSAFGSSLVRESRGESAFAPRIVQALAAWVIVLFIGMGWAYPFVGALIAVQLLIVLNRFSEGKSVWIGSNWVVAAAACALFAYVIGGGGVQGHTGLESKSSLIASLALLPYAVGSTWIGVEVLGAASFGYLPAFAFGTLCLVICALAVVRRLRAGFFSGSILPIYLISYALLTAASLCIARGGTGPSGVMASRYYMDLVFLPIGTIWLWAEHANLSSSKRSRLSLYGLSAFALLIVLGQLISARAEWATAPYRALAFRSMNQALLEGAATEAASQLLQSPHKDASAGAEVMARRRLSIFAVAAQVEPCSPDSLGFGDGWYGAEADGTWAAGVASLRVPSCGCDLVAKVYLPEGFKKRSLRITSGQGAQLVADLEPGELVDIRLPASNAISTYTIASSEVTVPSRDVPGGTDSRTLSALWARPTFSCLSSQPSAAQ